MNIRFLKPTAPCLKSNEGEDLVNQQVLDNSINYLEALRGYRNGLMVIIFVIILILVSTGILFKWYYFIIEVPLLIWSIRKFNYTNFELYVHEIMHQLTHEMFIEQKTGQRGALFQKIFDFNIEPYQGSKEL
jgi:hypothetical protein